MMTGRRRGEEGRQDSIHPSTGVRMMAMMLCGDGIGMRIHDWDWCRQTRGGQSDADRSSMFASSLMP